MWRSGAATLALVALLLEPSKTSAQFGDLAKLTSQVTKTVKAGVSKIPDKSGEELAKHAQKLLNSDKPKKIQEALQDQAKQALRVAQESAQPALTGAPKNSPGNATGTVAGIVAENISANTTVAPEVRASVSKPPEVAASSNTSEPAEGNPHKTEVMDALQAVGESLGKAGQVLNRTNSASIQRALNNTSTRKAADALTDAIPKSLPDALKPAALQKAQTGLQRAQEAIKVSRHADEIKKLGLDLASKFHLPSPHKVKQAITKNHPQVADVLKQATPVVQKALKNPEKLQSALRKTGPKVVEAINGGDSDDHDKEPSTDQQDELVDADGGGGGSSSSWQWAVLGMLLVTIALGGGWHLFSAFKRRDVRSPTLLTDSEMGMWMQTSGTGPKSRATPSDEEGLFQQF